MEYLGGKVCTVCGTQSLPICCYDFHHKIGTKEESISQMIQRKKILDQELKNELDKCAVVDANCHRMITARLTTIINYSHYINDNSKVVTHG
ncbi:MAG: hypothetical protein Q8L68_00300 [Methylococcales bacterium]|nr:hypothetical protein [Methylococcales bacterium]